MTTGSTTTNRSTSRSATTKTDQRLYRRRRNWFTSWSATTKLIDELIGDGEPGRRVDQRRVDRRRGNWSTSRSATTNGRRVYRRRRNTNDDLIRTSARGKRSSRGKCADDLATIEVDNRRFKRLVATLHCEWIYNAALLSRPVTHDQRVGNNPTESPPGFPW